jgi:uncharacterized protein (DUF2461 family)
MGYYIELSFNILKKGSIIELLNKFKNCAEECSCNNFYEDYEFENKTQFLRRHCIMTVNFSQQNINNMIEFFVQIIKNGVYVELIYDEDKGEILYASQYFITQKMDKYLAKEFNIQKRKRSYSDDENMILKTVSK